VRKSIVILILSVGIKYAMRDIFSDVITRNSALSVMECN